MTDAELDELERDIKAAFEGGSEGSVTANTADDALYALVDGYKTQRATLEEQGILLGKTEPTVLGQLSVRVIKALDDYRKFLVSQQPTSAVEAMLVVQTTRISNAVEDHLMYQREHGEA